MPETLNLNYYYGNEADQYSFYRIPCQPRYGARAAGRLSRPALCNTSIKPKEDFCMEHEINILVVEPGRPPRPARVD